METTRERKGWAYYDRPDDVPTAAITRRDLSILLELRENRFMNTRQLCALFGASVGRRLKVLFRAGLIDRPRASRIWRMREGGGSHPGIYAITNRGEQALIAFGLVEGGARDWSELNRTLSILSPKIPHELAVTDVRVAFRVACASRKLRVEPALERALSIPGTDRPLNPDWSFFVADERGKRELLFLEVHCGTEPLERYGTPDLSNLKGKYERYLAYAHGKRHVAQFGVSGFRVLTAITGGERMLENVVATAASVTGGTGANRFLATRLDELIGNDALAHAWRNAAGERAHLLTC